MRADGAAMTAAARLGLDAEVPSCPGWTVKTLLNHTGRVHAWAAATVAAGQLASFPPRPDEVTPEWFEEGVAELCGTLQGADPDAEVGNHLGAPERAIFWHRRMANETAVHRWDAEAAHAVTTPIDAGVAVCGIDEILDVYIPRALAQNPGADLGGSLHLHATDLHATDLNGTETGARNGNTHGGEWLVRIEAGRATVTRQHEKGDLAIRGTASDLLLLLWGRLDATEGPFETFGDAAVLDRWRALSLTS